MFGSRRVAVVALGTLLAAAACVPGGPPPPVPSDEIEVTQITTPDGDEVSFLWKTHMNERGEVVVTPNGTSDLYVWKDGEPTRVNPEGTSAAVGAISDSGQVVGTTPPQEPGESVPFSWQDGAWETLPLGRAAWGTAAAVNDRGTIVGLAYPGPDTSNPELVAWADGEIVRAPTVGVVLHDLAVPIIINNRDQVAFTTFLPNGGIRPQIWDIATGEVTNLGGDGLINVVSALNDRGMALLNMLNLDINGIRLRASLRHDGELAEIGTLPGDESSFALDLNIWGQVTGISQAADGLEPHPFLWYQGEMTPIDAPGMSPATGNVAQQMLAINNWGQVVGHRQPAGGDPRQAFLWQNGRSVNLGELANPGGTSYTVTINNAGQILGTRSQTGGGPAYLWTVSPLWGHPDGRSAHATR